VSSKLAVIAIGGNSLISNPAQTGIPEQWQAVNETCHHIADMIANGWEVIITHGNGPQVGFNLRRSELGEQHNLHPLPLDLIVAHTQGSIGYMLQQSLDNALRQLGINRTILTIITQVRVDQHDTAFDAPSKPIGGFMSEQDALKYQEAGWAIKEDAGRGWRRLVPSPRPQAIQEINAIKTLFQSGYIVIAGGGGGIPVSRNESGHLEGVYAVIDKDHASSLLAQQMRADLFIISTGIEQVAIHFNTPNQVDLDQMTLSEARKYINEGHFHAGSMLPKIQAAVEFVQMGGPKAIITNPANLKSALHGYTGTQILPG